MNVGVSLLSFGEVKVRRYMFLSFSEEVGLVQTMLPPVEEMGTVNKDMISAIDVCQP